jgi:hypothetical protein
MAMLAFILTVYVLFAPDLLDRSIDRSIVPAIAIPPAGERGRRRGRTAALERRPRWRNPRAVDPG